MANFVCNNLRESDEFRGLKRARKLKRRDYPGRRGVEAKARASSRILPSRMEGDDRAGCGSHSPKQVGHQKCSTFWSPQIFYVVFNEIPPECAARPCYQSPLSWSLGKSGSDHSCIFEPANVAPSNLEILLAHVQLLLRYLKRVLCKYRAVGCIYGQVALRVLLGVTRSELQLDGCTRSRVIRRSRALRVHVGCSKPNTEILPVPLHARRVLKPQKFEGSVLM